MWVFFVRDECERLVKNQASKMSQCSSRLAREKSNSRKATCEAHDWKLKSHARLSNLRERPSHKVPMKLSV